MPDLDNNQGALLVDVLNAGNTVSWKDYKEMCRKWNLFPHSLLVLGVLCFSDMKVMGGTYEGRGSTSDRDVEDESLVALTLIGAEMASQIRRVREVFFEAPPETSSSAVVVVSRTQRVRRPRRPRPQQLKLKLSGQAS